MVGKECAERLLVDDLVAQQLDLRLVDDVQGGIRLRFWVSMVSHDDGAA
jgi:hypothetical protein